MNVRPGPRRSAAVLLATALSAFNCPAAEQPVATDGLLLELAAGTARQLAFETDVATAFIADADTADVNVLGPRILFVLGKAPGVTTLRVHAADDTLIRAYAVRVHAPADHARTIVARIAGEGSGITVEPVGGALFVSGTAASPSQAERLLRGIAAVSAAPVVDALAIEDPPQVNLEVLISEVSRSVTNELGIDWSVDFNPFAHPLSTWATATGLRLGTGALGLAQIYQQTITFGDPNADDAEGVFTNEINEVGVDTAVRRGGDGGISLVHGKEVNSGKYRATAFLDALAQNGLLVVHARPNLTTVSGAPAEFFSGLEIPVPSITDRGVVGTVYRQTGVSLLFTPTVLSRDHISLLVEPRIRELAGGGTAIAGALVPNINERSARATVELADGESIAIAGLYSRNATASESGIPLLKDIPVWGALFRSAKQTDQSVELVIIVTARIVAAAPAPPASAATPAARSAQQLENAFYY